MKKMRIVTGVTALFIVSSFTAFTVINWIVNESYIIKCSVSQNGIFFKGLKAVIQFDEVNVEKSKIMATIDARSISSGSPEMTAHAKEALATDKFPEITFVSVAVKKTGVGTYEATGNLSLKGVTKMIKLPFSFDGKKDMNDKFPPRFKQTFYGIITISPSDFKVVRPGTPPEVTIELTIPVRQ